MTVVLPIEPYLVNKEFKEPSEMSAEEYDEREELREITRRAKQVQNKGLWNEEPMEWIKRHPKGFFKMQTPMWPDDDPERVLIQSRDTKELIDNRRIWIREAENTTEDADSGPYDPATDPEASLSWNPRLIYERPPVPNLLRFSTLIDRHNAVFLPAEERHFHELYAYGYPWGQYGHGIKWKDRKKGRKYNELICLSLHFKLLNGQSLYRFAQQIVCGVDFTDGKPVPEPSKLQSIEDPFIWYVLKHLARAIVYTQTGLEGDELDARLAGKHDKKKSRPDWDVLVHTRIGRWAESSQDLKTCPLVLHWIEEYERRDERKAASEHRGKDDPIPDESGDDDELDALLDSHFPRVVLTNFYDAYLMSDPVKWHPLRDPGEDGWDEYGPWRDVYDIGVVLYSLVMMRDRYACQSSPLRGDPPEWDMRRYCKTDDGRGHCTMGDNCLPHLLHEGWGRSITVDNRTRYPEPGYPTLRTREGRLRIQSLPTTEWLIKKALRVAERKMAAYETHIERVARKKTYPDPNPADGTKPRNYGAQGFVPTQEDRFGAQLMLYQPSSEAETEEEAKEEIERDMEKFIGPYRIEWVTYDRIAEAHRVPVNPPGTASEPKKTSEGKSVQQNDNQKDPVEGGAESQQRKEGGDADQRQQADGGQGNEGTGESGGGGGAAGGSQGQGGAGSGGGNNGNNGNDGNEQKGQPFKGLVLDFTADVSDADGSDRDADDKRYTDSEDESDDDEEERARKRRRSGGKETPKITTPQKGRAEEASEPTQASTPRVQLPQLGRG